MKLNQADLTKIKKLKFKLISLISLLFLLVIANLFVFNILSWQKIALAITGNYSKTSGQQLTSTDWNNLPNDFVARSGGAASKMSGALDMDSNRINNLAAPTANSDAVTKQYVDNALSGAGGGGDTFINWGQAVCPAGATLLYSGFAFNNYYSNTGGGGEPMCIRSGDAGPATAETLDSVVPLGTGVQSQMPPGIPEKKEIKCAACYKTGGSCFVLWGSQTCPTTSGFTTIYGGYGLGGAVVHNNQIIRHCVDNSNFDGTVNNLNWGAVWYGTVISDNSDVGLYTINSFIKCAMCCN